VWSVDEQPGAFAITVAAATWPALLEESVAAFADAACRGEPPPTALRRVRKIAPAPGDASAVWLEWWRALLALWSEEGLLPRSAGVLAGSTPLATHAVVRCTPRAALPAVAPAELVAVGADAAVIETAGGLRGRVLLARA
jgi:hypothetical protein